MTASGTRAYGAVLFDLDGTIYLAGGPTGTGNSATALPGAPAFVDGWRSAGARIGFLTNASVVSREDCVARLAAAGVGAGADEVLNAPLAVAGALAGAGVREVACIGGRGLRGAIAAAGIGVTGVDEVDPGTWPGPGRALAVGMAPEVSMATIHRAAHLVMAGTRVFATTDEGHGPHEAGCLPGTGPILAALRDLAPGVEPVVCGKPAQPFADMAAAFVAGAGPALMVGDNLGTDVALAGRLGWDSLLVLTGSGERPEPGGSLQPTWVATDLTRAPEAVRPPGR